MINIIIVEAKDGDISSTVVSEIKDGDTIMAIHDVAIDRTDFKCLEEHIGEKMTLEFTGINPRTEIRILDNMKSNILTFI